MEAPDRSDAKQRFVQRTRPDSADDAFMKSVQASYAAMDGYDKASMGLSPIPIIGDVAGIVNDARNYATGRQEFTPTNAALSALGVVPLVPSPAQIKRIVKRASPNDAAHYESVETGFLNSRGISSADKLTAEQRGQLERATGLFRGSDGIIRKEIDDSSMQFRTKHLQSPDDRGNVPASKSKVKEYKFDEEYGDIESIERPAEISDYITGIPEELRQIDDVRNLQVREMPPSSLGRSRAQAGKTNAGLPYVAWTKMPPYTQMGVVKHEMSHTVQDAQGLSPGGSSKNFLPEGVMWENATPDQKELAYAQYFAMPGEVEARTAQARSTLTKEQRAIYPFSQHYYENLQDAQATLNALRKKQGK